MKKTIGWIVLVTILCVTLLTCVGCGAKDDGRKKIVVTIFPVYDWVMNVLGDNASDYSVTLLLDSGADLHSYQPTVADIVAVAQADLFLYVGGESDGWVKDAMKNKKNKSMRTMDLLDLLGDRAKEEEIVEGMAHEEEEEEEGEVEYDEHVWLSLRNAAYYVRLIKDQIAAIDPDNAEIYEANAAAYVAKLNDLDARYVAARSAARCDTLVFGDRFPFRYLVDGDTGMAFKHLFNDAPVLNLVDVPTLKADTAKLLGREHLVFSDHEQYFFKDYLAYQPDYMEKVMVMSEMMQANGYRFLFIEDLVG